MDQEKLIRYIKGDPFSDAELTEILDWIERSGENKDDYEELKSLWVLTGISKTQANPSLKFFSDKAPIQRKIWTSELLRYAAIFVLAFLIGASSLYLYSSFSEPELAYNEIQVPNGEKSMISLYDGTKVWLNSGTTLRYPATFSKKERKVYLDGEGFFDVAKNKDCPFVVNAHDLDVNVLGTRFNVDAYDDDPEIRVTLERGSVFAKSQAATDGIFLVPGEQATYNRLSKEMSQQKVDTRLYSSWKENLLRFDDAPFIDVIKKMEHWYGVQITLDQSINPKDKFTMSIKTESLREMLNLIAKTTPIKYKINGDKVLIKRP